VRDVLHCLIRVLSYVLAVPANPLDERSRLQEVADEENMCLPILSFLNPVEEEDTIVFVVLVRILKLVKLFFLIEVVF
jgi:hypothetical protein